MNSTPARASQPAPLERSEPVERPAAVPFLRRPVDLIRANLRAYLALNVAAYGLTVLGLAIGVVFPELGDARAVALENDGTGELVRGLVSTPPLFALVILGVNVVRLSLLTIVLPSLVVPFAGLALFAYWAVETGITLAPADPEGWVILIPHSLTIIIELQAYVLLLLGAYLLGRHWLLPRTAGATTRRLGYVRGLQRLGFLAIPALGLLVVGAVWEAYSLRYLLHPLLEALIH